MLANMWQQNNYIACNGNSYDLSSEATSVFGQAQLDQLSVGSYSSVATFAGLEFAFALICTFQTIIRVFFLCLFIFPSYNKLFWQKSTHILKTCLILCLLCTDKSNYSWTAPVRRDRTWAISTVRMLFLFNAIIIYFCIYILFINYLFNNTGYN